MEFDRKDQLQDISVKYLLYFALFYKYNRNMMSQRNLGNWTENVKYTILVSNTWYISVFPKN
jgi:hypothetical protein